MLDVPNCRSFPDNLEFEAVLTFAGDEPGPEVRATAPAPQAITLTQHQSFVRLPDDAYRLRVWDPRSGSSGILFADHVLPIGADIDTRWLVRHRLEQLDPGAARSRVREPIIYYVDPGTPEPIRSALIEGASWWAQAFDSAGFIDAFRVQLLPAAADPLDVRCNVIRWVHRATRGWSYGGGVTDPRTGEMLKGHVTLGSLRIRQDRMIFEGLAGTQRCWCRSTSTSAMRSKPPPRASAGSDTAMPGAACHARGRPHPRTVPGAGTPPGAPLDIPPGPPIGSVDFADGCEWAAP